MMFWLTDNRSAPHMGGETACFSVVYEDVNSERM